MARTKSKTIYEKIEDKQAEIQNKNKELEVLQSELQELFKEQDELEMKQILEKIRENNIDINQALKLLSK